MDGLILAGGKSRRMERKYKGGLVYQGKSFLEHMIEVFKEEADTVLISYGEEIYREFEGCRIIKDIYPGCGPIGGLHAGCVEKGSTYIMAAACDMPLLGIELYHFLMQEMERRETERGRTADGIVPIGNGKFHPLAAIYRKQIGVILKEQIEAGEYRLRKALDRLDILYVDISGNERLCRMLRNINTMEEYRCL